MKGDGAARCSSVGRDGCAYMACATGGARDAAWGGETSAYPSLYPGGRSGFVAGASGGSSGSLRSEAFSEGALEGAEGGEEVYDMGPRPSDRWWSGPVSVVSIPSTWWGGV